MHRICWCAEHTLPWTVRRSSVSLRNEVATLQRGLVVVGVFLRALGKFNFRVRHLLIRNETQQVADTIETGAFLTVSTATVPGLRAVRTAISGGPILVRSGKTQRNGSLSDGTYEFTSMLERHPRSAIGWNDQYYFLVEVDGRQLDLSLGMTLEELANYMQELGCDEAMGLDGGGSATIWYEGKVRNSPCDGRERDIANSLVVLEKGTLAGTTNASVHR